MLKLVILLFLICGGFAHRKRLLVVLKATKCGGPFVKKKKINQINRMSVPQQMWH